MGYRWVADTCKPGYKVLLKMDDDVVLDVHRFFGVFYDPLNKDKKRQRIFCQVWKNASVNRSGKWKVEKGLFSNTSYSFPYCSGFLVAITPDIVKGMYEAAKVIDFFWIDDVFLYGMVPRAIKYIGFTNIGGWRAGLLTQSFKEYSNCFNMFKEQCTYVAIVTSNSAEFYQVYNNFPHQKFRNSTYHRK